MVELAVYVSLTLSVILTIIKIIEVIKNWKAPKIDIYVHSPDIKLKNSGNTKFAYLKFNIDLTNIGNEEAFIELLDISHFHKDGSSIGKGIDGGFKLPVHEKKSFVVEFSDEFNPNKNNKYKQEADKISITVTDKKMKKYIKEFYFSFPKAGGLMYW